MFDERMKVMIAYDGSSYADAAIDHLSRAGLPNDTEILLATAVDPADSRPAVSEFDLVSAASRRMDAVIAQARQLETRALDDARTMVSTVAGELGTRFPEWKIRFEVLHGNAVDRLLETAVAWQPDLIVAGSHGRTTIGRFFLGSVSQSLAEKATCSVRIVREGFEKSGSGPVELVICVTNPADVRRIVDSITTRVWNTEMRIRVVAVNDGVATESVPVPDLGCESVYENAVAPLIKVGTEVSTFIESGDAKSIWLREAEASHADTIFVAANGNGEPGLDRPALGLITDAKTTVEIVRP